MKRKPIFSNIQQTRAEDALDKIKTLKQQEKQRARDIQRTKDSIAKLQEKVDNPPEFEDVTELDHQRVWLYLASYRIEFNNVFSAKSMPVVVS